MNWLQIHIHSDKTSADLITDILNDLNAEAVTYEDAGDAPIFEPDIGTTPLWPRIKITALFPGDTDPVPLKKALTEALHQHQLSAQLSIETLVEQPWERVWMDKFHPLKFGENLWICPSWIAPPDPNAINILMDPGLAFGSGTHPTTAMCLTWLSQNPPEDKFVIDYGCGSGVLGVAASKLGAKKILSVDIDPQALLATRNNSLRNDCHNIHVAYPHQLPPVKADLIVANILAGPLEALADVFWALSHAETCLLLSGLLKTQVAPLIHAYQGKFRLELIETQSDWALLHGYCAKNIL